MGFRSVVALFQFLRIVDLAVDGTARLYSSKAAEFVFFSISGEFCVAAAMYELAIFCLISDAKPSRRTPCFSGTTSKTMFASSPHAIFLKARCSHSDTSAGSGLPCFCEISIASACAHSRRWRSTNRLVAVGVLDLMVLLMPQPSCPMPSRWHFAGSFQ